MTSVRENLSEASARAMAKSAAAGTYGECSAGGCVIKRTLAACGGVGGVWRCEFSGSSGTSTPDKQCSGSGSGYVDANNNFSSVTLTPAPSSTVTATVTTTPQPGKCPGYVNGVLIYVSCSDTVDLPLTHTSSTSNGTGTGASTTTQTTTEETKCSGASCYTDKTTTQSVTRGDGSTQTATNTVTVQVTKDSYCKTNPTSTACADVTVNRVSGACAAFVCGGDAALCAIAEATHKQKCLLDTSSAESGVYDSVKNNGTATGIVSSSVTISNSSFDTSNALGVGAACITDRAITVWGTSVTVPFSQVCPAVAVLGNLMLALSFLTAFVIVGRG